MADKKQFNTLFLDRDGVINEQRPGDYVKSQDEFVFIDGALEAIHELSDYFKYIIIVTNQRGIGKGKMTLSDLYSIHTYMLRQIGIVGYIDRILFCPSADNDDPNRKPNIGMALQAKEEFPDIDFADSWMAGDSRSDIQFANRAGIRAALIGNKYHPKELKDLDIYVQCPDLRTFTSFIREELNG